MFKMPTIKNSFYSLTVCAAIALTLSGCSKNTEVAAQEDGLTILAGSELKAIEPLINEASTALGFPITVKYVGTIEGVESIKGGDNYSIAWFGNAKYFYDTPESAKRIKLSEKIMFSPVIVGVKESSAQTNKITEDVNYTWKDIASWVKDKHMTYAMTDPSVSNTGYVALMGVAYATSNKGENLKMADINPQVLKDFFQGQKVTAKSSNWLMDTFQADPKIDFIINYESTILANNVANPTKKLVPVYPVEGIVTSDYPMLLLDDAKTEKYKQLVAYLKTVEAQTKLVNDYKYHSVLPEVMQKQKVFNNSQLLVEMPFNPDNNLSDAILTSYFNDYKKPAKFVFVIDTSGSMAGDREAALKNTVAQLTSGKLSKYVSIRNREEVTVIPFSTQPNDLKVFDSQHQQDLSAYVNGLNMDGGTAMYSAVEVAVTKLKEDMKVNGNKYRYSIVVLTDGLTNTGDNYAQFAQWYASLGMTQGDIRIFAISFGEADINELKKMTDLTGGNVFDGNKSLTSTFKEIRSYQ